MPVVPSVTPAPIVITEPVAAPQVPAPVTIVEPVKESVETNQSIPEKPANPEAIAVPTTITVPEKQVIQDNRIDSSAVNGSGNTIPATNKSDSSSNFVPVESYIGQ